MRPIWVAGVLAALLLAVPTLAACTESSADDGMATLATEGSAGSPGEDDAGGVSDDPEQVAMQFAECMRENGVTDFPDPEVDSDGNVSFPGLINQQGGNRDRESVRAAREACAEFSEGLRSSFTEGDSTELQDTLLAYAECMRENGYNMPDPDLGGGGRAFGEELDRDDPAFAKAHDVCQHELQPMMRSNGSGT